MSAHLRTDLPFHAQVHILSILTALLESLLLSNSASITLKAFKARPTPALTHESIYSYSHVYNHASTQIFTHISLDIYAAPIHSSILTHDQKPTRLALRPPVINISFYPSGPLSRSTIPAASTHPFLSSNPPAFLLPIHLSSIPLSWCTWWVLVRPATCSQQYTTPPICITCPPRHPSIHHQRHDLGSPYLSP